MVETKPTVQMVQTHVRLIYSDGTVASVATVPQETKIDPFEGLNSKPEVIQQIIAEQVDAIGSTVLRSGADLLYEKAKANKLKEVEEIERRADEAKKRRDAFLAATRKPEESSDADSNPSEGSDIQQPDANDG